MKTNDWSINLEDPFYEENREELLKAAIDAVKSTASGCYVNLVMPATIDDPENDLILELKSRFELANISIKNIRYVDQCGCGGHVIRVTV